MGHPVRHIFILIFFFFLNLKGVCKWRTEMLARARMIRTDMNGKTKRSFFYFLLFFLLAVNYELYLIVTRFKIKRLANPLESAETSCPSHFGGVRLKASKARLPSSINVHLKCSMMNIYVPR